MPDNTAVEKLRRQTVGALCQEIIEGGNLNPFEVAQCIIILHSLDMEQLLAIFKGHEASSKNRPQLARVVFNFAQRATMQRVLEILKDLSVPGRATLLTQLTGLGFS